jgi:putative endonuclease
MSGAYIYILGAREKQLKGWQCTMKPNLIHTINPEFKGLAQTWGWKMIT